MSSANEHQVGGSHYQDATGKCPVCGSAIQHWDLFAMMPYLVGQVCRYVIRFRGKNGREDLKKARHFLDKLEEVYYPEPKALVEPPVPSTPEWLQCASRRPQGPDNRCMLQRNHKALHTDGHACWDDELNADDARKRADEYANQKLNSDVPPGWVLEEAAAVGTWHYRPVAGGGTLWSPVFADRATALAALNAQIASTTPAKA